MFEFQMQFLNKAIQILQLQLPWWMWNDSHKRIDGYSF